MGLAFGHVPGVSPGANRCPVTKKGGRCERETHRFQGGDLVCVARRGFLDEPSVVSFDHMLCHARHALGQTVCPYS